MCGGDLAEVFRRSCNIPFAKTAVELGPDKMVEGVEEWGVGEQIPFDLPYPPQKVASTFGPTDNLDDNLPLLAIRGFGQESVQMVPLHMAMVASTVANGGRMMKPYVVDARLDHSGRVLDRADPDVWKQPMSTGTARTLTELMKQVATDGTASCCIALNGGIPVAAKTGTAQLNAPDEPEQFARVDHGLRSRRRPAVRSRRDARRDQRRDLGEHRRPARRADRQDRARCGAGRGLTWHDVSLDRSARLAIEAILGSLNRRFAHGPHASRRSCDP